MKATKGQECLICKEEYGARSSETETTERQIRLPCNANHMVGSNCISIWLQDHNTCPICRYIFFPAEKTKSERPAAVYVDFVDDDDTSDPGQTSDDEDFMYEEGDIDEEDENMSDIDEGMTDGDSEMDDGDEKDDDYEG